MNPLFPKNDAEKLIELALAEDFGAAGDLSSTLTLSKNEQSTAQILSKTKGVLAGLPIIPLIFEKMKTEVELQLHFQDGDSVQKGDLIAEIKGATVALLGAERTLLNFLQQLSGVATSTAAYVAETAGTHCQILDTRKTIPGWRTLQKYAVRCGGGTNHRIGLFDMIMLKDNHIAASGGVAPAIQKVLRSRPSGIPIEVEVENLEQLEIVLPYPVEQIMLDNMDLETMKKAVERILSYPHSAKIEASGNMTLDRIAAVAATGVDYISIGALTHTIAALDLSMRFV